MDSNEPPRPLSEREKSVLDTLLSVDADWTDPFRRQIKHTEVTRSWRQNSLSVDLRVTNAPVRAEIPPGPALIDAEITDHGAQIGEIILRTTHGYLSAIEYAWYTDEAPSELPHPCQIRLTTHDK